MRVFVLVLAILLLPLRGWLGDAMGTAMALEAVQTTPTTRGMHTTHTMPAGDPAMHHAMAAQAGDLHQGHEGHEGHDGYEGHDGQAAASAQAATDCPSTCTDCQLCHSATMAPRPAMTAALDAPRVAPAFAPAAFASAEPAPGFKPPIS